MKGVFLLVLISSIPIWIFFLISATCYLISLRESLYLPKLNCSIFFELSGCLKLNMEFTLLVSHIFSWSLIFSLFSYANLGK